MFNQGPQLRSAMEKCDMTNAGTPLNFYMFRFPTYFFSLKLFLQRRPIFRSKHCFYLSAGVAEKMGSIECVRGSNAVQLCWLFPGSNIFKSKTLKLVFAQRPGCNHSRWTLAGVMGATATNPGAFAAISRVRANPSADPGLYFSLFWLNFLVIHNPNIYMLSWYVCVKLTIGAKLNKSWSTNVSVLYEIIKNYKRPFRDLRPR